MLMYRKHLANPLVSLVLIITCSVSLFYTQVHAWVSVYPILLIALAGFTTQTDRSKKIFVVSKLLVLVLIGFLILPRLSGYVADEYRYHYLVAQNLVRFGALWFCAVDLVKQILAADKLMVHPHHA